MNYDFLTSPKSLSADRQALLSKERTLRNLPLFDKERE
jgi:hypothetical protein